MVIKAESALVIDRDAEFSGVVLAGLREWGLTLDPVVLKSRAGIEAAALSAVGVPFVVVGDCVTADALHVVREVRRLRPDSIIVFSPPQTSEEVAVGAWRAGSNDYLPRPFCARDLHACLDRCLGPHSPTLAQAKTPSPEERFVFRSDTMRAIRDYVGKVALRECNVLITGETGTGKEVVARLIKDLGPRRARRLETINCAALPDSLLESELFGYERGAFTGADRAYPGRLRLAAGGTVFLDEIGEMSPQGQAKLLRVLEAREVVPLGSHRSVPLDVRIVAATNQEPEEMISERRFRSDLFFRLSVARVHIPPLRERKDDVIPLFEHVLREMNGRYRASIDRVSPDVYDRLLSYGWPGNVRELRNVVEALFIDPPAREITISDLPPPLHWTEAAPPRAEGERHRLIAALSTTRWNKSEAAKQLQCSRMTLYRKMSKYALPQQAPLSLSPEPTRTDD